MNNSDHTLDVMISTMISILDDYLPPQRRSLPKHGVSVVRITEKTVGLGNYRGMDRRGAFVVRALKGSRLDAVVRFHVWSKDSDDVDAEIERLHGRLLSAINDLWAGGFLRMAVEKTSLAEYVEKPKAWRKTTDYGVLYEYRYPDSDGAESLITRIPININSEYHVSTTVTDDMVRWDNETAPSLVVRGQFNVGKLSVFAFVHSPPPTGAITLTRTYDGASDPPTSYPTLADFVAAVAGADATECHGQVTFSSLTDFLDEFRDVSSIDEPMTLGDWNNDGVPDEYKPYILTLQPAILLQGKADRVELTYQNIRFDEVAVVYLKATQS